MTTRMHCILGTFVCVVLLHGLAHGEAIVSNFSGGDPGEGLDLEAAPGGSFVYAVRFTSEPGPAARTVGGLAFSRELDVPGVTVSGSSVVRSNNWGAQPEYGNTPGDDALEEIMWDIYFGGSESTLHLDLAVEPDTAYKLQLLFSENFYTSADRSFDVVLRGVTEVDDLNVYSEGGGSKDPDPDAGVVLSYEFHSGPDTSLAIDLAATGNANDATPILSALTLEQVPEPSTLVLGCVAMLLLAAYRRRV